MKKIKINNEKLKEVSGKSKGLIDEFKTFIKRGNVIDLAVGVIIGSAFSSIVSSLVDDILMPLIGVVIGGYDFSELSIKIGQSTIKYGMFIQNIINFLIIAFCVFIFVKLLNKLEHHKEENKKEEKVKSDETILLTEIRDLLKNK